MSAHDVHIACPHHPCVTEEGVGAALGRQAAECGSLRFTIMPEFGHGTMSAATQQKQVTPISTSPGLPPLVSCSLSLPHTLHPSPSATQAWPTIFLFLK